VGAVAAEPESWGRLVRFDPGRRWYRRVELADVASAFAESAITVHAYSPPLTAMRRYELTESGLVPAATEHADQGRSRTLLRW